MSDALHRMAAVRVIKMSKKGNKGKKDKRTRPRPKPNQQIPNSLIRPFNFGLIPALQNAREYPLHGCWIMEGWQDEGITPVVVARSQDNGRILFGVYLVDYYCLGIKDAYTRVDYSPNRFERDLPQFCANAPISCPVELAHELIYGALEYAQKLGFDPHPDFYKQKADKILDPPDAHPRTNGVTFGKDGKPFYVSGPYDTEMKSKSVINTLMRTRGPGNFDYLIGFRDMPDEIM
jgi:hypothetical protein